jgi:hypothetical protein
VAKVCNTTPGRSAPRLAWERNNTKYVIFFLYSWTVSL